MERRLGWGENDITVHCVKISGDQAGMTRRRERKQIVLRGTFSQNAVFPEFRKYRRCRARNANADVHADVRVRVHVRVRVRVSAGVRASAGVSVRAGVRAGAS